MKTKHSILIIAVSVLLTVALPVFAVDIRVKKEKETPLRSNAPLFLRDEVVDLNVKFLPFEIDVAQLGLDLTKSEDEVMTKILENGTLTANDIHDFVSVFRKQLKGKVFTSDERKYLLGITGENRSVEDRMKFLARRKLKEI